MTGHFDNKEQFTEMKEAGKIFPLGIAVRLVAQGAADADDFAAEGVHALCKFGTDIAHADYECATVPDTADGAFIVPSMSLLVAIVAVEFLLQHQYGF